MTLNKHRFFLLGFSLFLLFFCLTTYSQDEIISVRMLTYNIRHGAGMDDVIDLDRQAAAIQKANAEVIGLQEVDSCVKRSGYIPEAAVLAEKLGMYSVFGGAIPLTGGKYGVAILSKEPPLAVHHMPLPGTELRTLLVCEFENYVFATTHLDLNDSCRFASLPIIIEEAASWGDKPFFICGDWNDQPSSTLIKTMKDEGFVMLSYPTTPNSSYYTFPASSPNKIIDYIASYGKVVKSVRRRQVLNEPEASDHRPVLVEVRLKSYSTGIESAWEDNEQEEYFDLTGKKMPEGKLPKGIYVQKNKRRTVVVK